MFTFENEDFKRLQAVMVRLYDDKPLTPDARRDLANTLHALIGKAIEIPQTK